jgi:nitric-oxide synthase
LPKGSQSDAVKINNLQVIAKQMGLHMDKSNPFWKDKALVVLNEAVHFSFQKSGVTLADHHAASEQFMKFIRNEEAENRTRRNMRTRRRSRRGRI